MKNILDKLHHDHINAAKLLDLYEKQLEILKQGGNPDYPVMQDIMKYMKYYPDVVHHPLEEVIFEKLEIRDKEIANSIARLYKEHSEIDDMGDKLAETLLKITTGEITSLEDFQNDSENYLQLMRSHMDLEESEVFPAIKEFLSDDDWDNIDLVLAGYNDPLFGDKVEEEYRNLFRSITGS